VTGSEIDVKPFPPKWLVNACKILSIFSSVLSFTLTLWQYVSVSTAITMMKLSEFGFISIKVSRLATEFTWIIVTLLFLEVLGVLAMSLSLSILDKFNGI